MLELRNVTLMGIDAVTPKKTLEAMLYSARFTNFSEIVLATTETKASELNLHRRGIRLHPIVQSDDKIIGPGRQYFKEYELQQLTVPFEAIHTDFVLMQEWDAALLNPLAWDDSWFRLDYVGALWSEYYEPGWPPAYGNFKVGNGGFSLRSRKLCQFLRTAALTWHDDPGLMSYDQWIGKTMRPWLEENGMVFGTDEQALKFSCEDTVYTGQFGFHGKNTVRLNGWKLDWMQEAPLDESK